MSTLNRRNSEKKIPDYKDYVNFVSAYRNGKKIPTNDSGVEVEISNLSNTYEIPLNHAKVESYSKFLERTTATKFVSVKPPVAAKKNSDDTTPKKTVKTEIFLQIDDHPNLVRENSFVKTMEMFENHENSKRTDNDKEQERNFSKNVTEKKKNFETILHNSLNKQKNRLVHHDYMDGKEIKKIHSCSSSETHENITNLSEIPQRKSDEKCKADTPEQVSNKVFDTTDHEIITRINYKTSSTLENAKKNTDPSPVFNNEISETETFNCRIPTPPAMPTNQMLRVETKKNEKPILNSSRATNPLVKKLAYGAMLDMYGAYHDKANSYVATLPRSQVKRDSNLQKIINNIAAQGGLEKLSGRSNPKDEIE